MGSNTSTTPTSDIQTKLGGLAVDNKYGPKTTAAVQQFQQANGLKVDGIFGPITQAAFNSKYNAPAVPASNLITTSGSSRSDYSKNTAELTAALQRYNAPLGDPNATESKSNPTPEKDPILNDTVSGTTSDPFLQQLDTLSMTSNASTKALINNIKAIKARQTGAIDTQYNNYKAGLQTLGIQTGQASATPDILMSHIKEAEAEHQQKITDLNNEEIKALSDAENAQSEKDFKTLAQKMDYVKQIRAEKTTALKNYQDAITTQADKIQKQGDATAKVIAPDIYKTLQTLDAGDQESFLISISQKFKIPLSSLTTALVAQKATEDKAKNDNMLSPTEAATLGVPYGTTKEEAAKKGITPDRYKPTNPKAASSAQTKKAAEDEITNALKTGKDANGNVLGNPRGSDGFVDPSVYSMALEKWPGTQKEFLAKFPVVGSVNPASYSKLPVAIQPVKKKSSGRGS